MAFLEATLALLESREGQRAEAPPTYRPAPLDLWRVSDAVLRITELLGQQPGKLPIERCLPAVTVEAPDQPLRLRAAIASTLVAGLELARDEKLTLLQQEAFGPVILRRYTHEGLGTLESGRELTSTGE